MNDLISRQAAINALKGLPTWWADSGGFYGGAQPPMTALLDPEDAISAIENLPTEQPERKKGEWIREDMWSEGCGMGETYGFYWRCSNCDEITQGDYYQCGANFCPNCGAKMEVDT